MQELLNATGNAVSLENFGFADVLAQRSEVERLNYSMDGKELYQDSTYIWAQTK